MIVRSIHTKYYLITESISKKEVELKYVKIQDQVSCKYLHEITKIEEFQRVRAKIGVKKN